MPSSMEVYGAIDESIKVKLILDGMHESCAVDLKVGPLHFYLSEEQAADLAKQLLNVLTKES